MFRVYDGDGDYRATIVFAEDAAAMVAFLGEGATIQNRTGRVLWREGSEDKAASESYDHVADVVATRLLRVVNRG